MPNKTEISKVFGNSSVLNTVMFENTTLQTLDRRVGDGQLIFPREQFEKSVNTWEGIPIIYHPHGRHPMNFDAIREDAFAEAKKMGGRVIGYVVNPRIEVEGHPRLVCSVDLLDGNDDIIEMWKEGKLTPSTAFLASDDGDKLTSPPVPNHVLFFNEVVDKIQPGDPGALVNTSESKSMSVEEKKNRMPFYEWVKSLVLKTIEDDRKSHSSGEPVANSEDELAKSQEDDIMPEDSAAGGSDLEAINKALEEKDAKISELEAKIIALEEQIAGSEEMKQELEQTKAELNTFKEVEKDNKFNTFLHSIPEGKKATEEMVKDLRKKFEEDPVSLMLNVLSSKEDSGATTKQGEPFVNTKSAEEDNWEMWNGKKGE